jgi:RNA polymerase sigma-32 factor
MVAALPTLSVAERERDLCVRAKAGDRVALADLLAMHDRFFRRAAIRYGVDPDDGAQEARIAAMQALNGYDPDTGFRFLTYASKKVSFVLRHMRQSGGVIRTPHWQNVNKTSEATQGRARQAKRVASIDAPATDRGDSWASLLRDRSDVVADVIGAEDAARVNDAIGRIPARERTILTRRLNGDTLDAIGRTIGVTRERVRQLEAKALGSLRYAMLARQPVPC